MILQRNLIHFRPYRPHQSELWQANCTKRTAHSHEALYLSWSLLAQNIYTLTGHFIRYSLIVQVGIHLEHRSFKTTDGKTAARATAYNEKNVCMLILVVLIIFIVVILNWTLFDLFDLLQWGNMAK